MNLYLGLTDTDWFNYLSRINQEDVNFWQPGGHRAFKVLERGAPFLFKLKNPINAIGGVGFFVSQFFLPISLAWDTFRNGNGCGSFTEFKSAIIKYRNGEKAQEIDPVIGCIVLTDPVFFKPEDWISAPIDWKKNIVSGKSYSTEEPIGADIWKQVEQRLERYNFYDKDMKEGDAIGADPSLTNRYGSYLAKVRLGQGSFRLLITDIYNRRCAVSGERTLPVLEAAHIKPYSESGPHAIQNGLLLRSDLHKLFDAGYVTVTQDYSIEVSRKIREEFQNGRDYYKFHGKKLVELPGNAQEQPGGGYLLWHNENVFRG